MPRNQVVSPEKPQRKIISFGVTARIAGWTPTPRVVFQCPFWAAKYASPRFVLLGPVGKSLAEQVVLRLDDLVKRRENPRFGIVPVSEFILTRDPVAAEVGIDDLLAVELDGKPADAFELVSVFSQPAHKFRDKLIEHGAADNSDVDPHYIVVRFFQGLADPFPFGQFINLLPDNIDDDLEEYGKQWRADNREKVVAHFKRRLDNPEDVKAHFKRRSGPRPVPDREPEPFLGMLAEEVAEAAKCDLTAKIDPNSIAKGVRGDPAITPPIETIDALVTWHQTYLIGDPSTKAGDVVDIFGAFDMGFDLKSGDRCCPAGEIALLTRHLKEWPTIGCVNAGDYIYHMIAELDEHRPNLLEVDWDSEVSPDVYSVLRRFFDRLSAILRVVLKRFETYLESIAASVEEQEPAEDHDGEAGSAKVSPVSLVEGDDNDNPPAEQEHLVTLLQAAPMVNRSKRTLERLKDHAQFPKLRVHGGGGKPNEYSWSEMRSFLSDYYNRPLPERHPADPRHSV